MSSRSLPARRGLCPAPSALLILFLLAAAALPVPGAFLPAPSAKGVDQGELLLGELNCVACHAADAAVVTRLNPRPAPRLGAQGLRLSPPWMQRWLSEPAAAKPGTLMPHALHGLPPAERAQSAEDLVHFLVSIAPAGPAPAVSADPARARAGQALYHELGCVACHAPTEPRDGVTAESLARLDAGSIPLGRLAEKYPAGELARFLRDPLAHRPGGRMPSFNLAEAEAVSLATWLVREQLAETARGESAPVAGLQFDYFERRFGSCSEFDQATPKSSGVTDTITTKMAGRASNFGLRYKGVLEVPADGEYTFSLRSDDGSQLHLDGRLLIDNDGEHGPTQKSGRATLKAGPHSFTLLFYQVGAGHELSLRWSGPGFDRRPIPAGAFKHFARPLLPVGHTEFTVDPAKATRGRELFAAQGCVSCHQVEGLTARPARPLLDLAARTTAGCLADTVPAGAPKFDLTPAQRAALRKTVAAAADLTRPATPGLRVAHTLTRLNCLACHTRDGLGGPLENGRADWFALRGEADLGDEGRLPPLLDRVGMKLKPAWLERIIAEGPKARPYMATRMPSFGAAHAHQLAADFVAADKPADARPEPVLGERDARIGWKLVGRDGLNCIACHTFTTYGSTGIPALALDQMAGRVTWDWFRRYLPEPAALRPGTRMPSFWPDGKAVNTAVLGGNTDAQILAIWAWLNQGPKAEVPSGLIRGRKELVADAEAVIYRHFIQGAGSRAIGVGYPEKANLAFDANELRLALIWQGSFIDLARHSTDRGAGFEPPLGDHVVKLPAGPAFATLPTADAPWPAAPNRLSGPNRFLGYQLDAKRQPTFRYRAGTVTIEEFPQPRAGEVDMTFVRRFKLSGTADGPLWFRAASGNLQPAGPGAFRVDGNLTVRFTGGGEPRLVGKDLRLPVTVPGEFTVEMTW